MVFFLIAMGFLSAIPVVAMNNNNEDNKYRCLKILVNVAFLWTILIFIERMASNNFVIYYSHMLGFPIKFLLATLMVCTIFNYIETRMPRAIMIVFGVLFAIELILVLLNNEYQFLLLIKPVNGLVYTDMYQAEKGFVFIYHLSIVYLILLGGIGYLFIFLKKHRNVRQYQLITRTMIYSVIIVLIFNMLQLLLRISNVDLTYISLVVVSFLLYQAIYRKDMVFNLKTSGRGEILSNMREMYILTDADKNVVEISSLLMSKYEISSQIYIGKPLDILLTGLESKIVFYHDYQIDTDDNDHKDHFHLREKKFTLKGMKEFGYMILLYDETQVFTLLRDLNRLSNYDTMTSLHNRNYIEHILEKMDAIENIGVISLDLNGLKINNDYLGHERGDYLLKTLALKMKLVMKRFPHYDMARIGGDEFLIIVYDTSQEMIEKIKTEILEECYEEDIEKLVSVSIGTAFEEKLKDIYLLIQKADESMYQMKQNTSKQYAQLIIGYLQKQQSFIR